MRWVFGAYNEHDEWVAGHWRPVPREEPDAADGTTWALGRQLRLVEMKGRVLARIDREWPLRAEPLSGDEWAAMTLRPREIARLRFERWRWAREDVTRR